MSSVSWKDRKRRWAERARPVIGILQPDYAQVFMAPIGRSLGQLGHSPRTRKHVRYIWGRGLQPLPPERGWGPGLPAGEAGRRGRAPSLLKFAARESHIPS
jgi:hypothetical protein